VKNIPRPVVRPVVLCILDGWGHRPDRADNGIALANTPVYDRLLASCGHALLQTSGLAVGLPDGQMGNSEVGHQNIGAGRVVMQDLPRIDAAVANGSLAANPRLGQFIETLRNSGGACHLLGLLSPGGVHAHSDHIVALARIIAGAGIPVWLHCFMDGRDTPPNSGAGNMADVLTETAADYNIRVATVSGRYYAMDRDQRWERVSLAYGAMVEGTGEDAGGGDPAEAIGQSFAGEVGDEVILPTVMAGYDGMGDGDGLLMANFRADRAREILAALVDPDFDGFARARVVAFADRLGMTRYSNHLDAMLGTLFQTDRPRHTLGEVVSSAGLRQLRIAETEKYAHITFFLNGGEEAVFEGEDRILVPSPKVATYDLAPEMSAREVTDRLAAAIRDDVYDLIVVNYANPDMVGHTGNLAAAIKAVEMIDKCLDRLIDALDAVGGAMLITADHGNIEMMRDPETDGRHTQHTNGPVPVLLVNRQTGQQSGQVALRDGSLSDLAPTVLALMGLAQPDLMTGGSLLAPFGQMARQG
jgi:2,3-bisphosphoglycerate-independent phosphoglycerate mutase